MNLESENFPILVRNGDEFYDSVISLIQNAKSSIFLHMYILTLDSDTRPLFDLLIEKAKQNIKIYIIIDGFGSINFDRSYLQKLKSGKINIDFFSPVSARNFGNIGRRLHQKVVLIDHSYALIGGTNLSEEFIHPMIGIPWLDYACIINDSAVLEVVKKIRRIYLKVFPHNKDEIQTLLRIPNYDFNLNKIRVVENDYTRIKKEIRNSYIKLIQNTKESITLTATYFIPDKKLLKSFKNARKRGVKIELIFGEQSDVKTYHLGEKYLFPWYHKENIHIYIWDKSIIHGKIALFDDQIASIGSYNHNIISKYANIEMNVVIDNLSFGKNLREEIELIKNHCKKIQTKDFNKYSLFQRFTYFLFYHFSTLLDTVQTFLILKKK